MTRDGTPIPLRGGRRRKLVALLAQHHGAVASVDAIADALWGDASPANSAGAVQSLVSELRTALGDASVIVHDPPGYRLRADVEIDARRFVDAINSGREEDALSLWRGPAFEEFAHEHWANIEAQRLEGLRRAAIAARIERRLGSGRPDDVLVDLEALVAQDPLDERLRGLLMIALYRCGRQADALRAYTDLRAALRDELGIDPSPALRQLEASILRQEPELELN